jgi:hypothetical protein
MLFAHSPMHEQQGFLWQVNMRLACIRHCTSDGHKLLHEKRRFHLPNNKGPVVWISLSFFPIGPKLVTTMMFRQN